MLIVSQLPDISPTAFGQWVFSLAALMTVGVLAKSLFFKDKAPGERPVTRSELDSILVNYPRNEAIARHATREDLAAVEERMISRSRETAAGLEEVKRNLAVLSNELGHFGRTLEKIASKLGVMSDSHPPE